MAKPKFTWYAIRRPKPPNLGGFPTENIPLFNSDDQPCADHLEACLAVDRLNGEYSMYTYQLVDTKPRKTQGRFYFRDTWQERKNAVAQDYWTYYDDAI